MSGFFNFKRKAVGPLFDRNQILTSSIKARKSNITTAAGCSQNFGGGGSGSGFSGMSSMSGPGGRNSSRTQRFNPVQENLAEELLFQTWLPKDEPSLHQLYRDIHMYDAIAGSAVDLVATLPFSDFNLVGVEDKEILKIYESSVENLDIRESMVQMTTEFLVIGKFVYSLLFDKTKGIWTDMIAQDIDACRITPIPIHGFEPKIDIKVDPLFQQFLKSPDIRDVEARNAVPKDLLSKLQRGGWVQLDPLNTLYVGRKSNPRDLGTSYLARTLPFYAIEKALIDGTLVESRRRQRAILHVQAGIDELWEPLPEEMDAIASLFIQADEDPNGAVVVTRTGVEAQEIRAGGDFWKLGDEWGFLSEAKMRALGINESFLSGDAVYSCYVGDTLIPTELGLLRINQIPEKLGMDTPKEGENCKIDLKVGSRHNPGKAKVWLNVGKAPTIKIKTASGHELQPTPNEPLLVLRGNEHEWIKTEDLKIGDYLCINPKSVTRKKKLELNLKDPLKAINGKRKEVKKPKYMTPDLAYLLGLIIAEGGVSRGYATSFTNADTYMLDKFDECTKNIFGLDISQSNGICNKKGDIVTIKGVQAKCNADVHTRHIYSTTVVQWFEQLGLYCGKTKYNKTPSYWKVIPWSILEADEKSQLAFLAAYLEGDGSTKQSGIWFYSRSNKLLKQMQILINSHGIMCHRGKYALNLNKQMSVKLFNKISPYFSAEWDHDLDKNVVDKTHGIPNEHIQEFMESRKGKQTKYGIFFTNDEGKKIKIKEWVKWNNGRGCYIAKDTLLYDLYDAGKYDAGFRCLKKVSKKEYDKLKKLFTNRYYYTPIISLRKGGKVPVYDLSMGKKHEPSFQVNGIVGKNTMEVALSVFIEMIRNLREVLTYRIFEKNIFQTLARVHGFKKRTTAELNHRIRIGGNKYTSVKDGLKIDESNLIIPQVHWSKQLRPEADESYLDVLSRMEEKGIPIPLRTRAAAGGVNLDKIIDMLDDDAKYRGRIKEYKAKVGGGEEEGGAWGSIDNMFWGSKNNFLALKKKEFRKVLKAIRQNRKVSPMKVAAKVLNDAEEKVEAAGYILRRTGIAPNFTPKRDTINKVGKHINNIADIKKNKLTNRKVAFEYAAMSTLLNPDKESKTPIIDSQIPHFDSIPNNSKQLLSGV